MRAPGLALAATLLAAPAVASGRAAFIARYECDLVVRLARIHNGDRSTARNRFLTVALVGRPGAYVQCIFAPGDRLILCEAASGAFGPGPLPPPGRAAILGRLGFATKPGGNDVQELALADPPNLRRIARLILVTLHDAYDARLHDPSPSPPRTPPAPCSIRRSARR
jgi:hypothetical protein